MKWEAIGAVAESVAAFGVIITLVYLAVQIPEQNKQSRLSASRDLARDWADGLN